MTSATVEPAPLLSRDEIERKAAEVLHANGFDITPANPVLVASRLGIELLNVEFADGNHVTATERVGGLVSIAVQASDAPYRKRFAIAHAIGHCVLHMPGDGQLVDREVDLFWGVSGDPGTVPPNRRREAEANLFALALLMPAPDVRTAWERLGSLDAMARRFDVTEDAIGLRIAQLGLA